jgi:hypothetical protein
MIEWEADHALAHIQRIVDEDLAWVDVKEDVQAEYNEKIQKDIAAVEPWMDSCSGYYRSASGRIVTQWPHNMGAFRDMLAKFDPDAYDSTPR